jgi:deoxyadenosine/deoxycytidine kinase
MIILINGTLGVGKTWIARWLLCQLPESAYIEGDTLGFVSPELFQGSSRKAFALEVALDLVSAFRKRNAKTIVFDQLFVDPELYDSFVWRVGGPVQSFYLSASPEVIRSRIQQRGRPQVEREMAEAQEVEKTQRTLLGAARLGTEINTDELSPERVVGLIQKRLIIG